MKAKNKMKLLIALVLMIFCTIFSASSTNVEAAVQSTVTGDEMMEYAKKLASVSTYSGVGTCTGFFVKVLRNFGIGSTITDYNSPGGTHTPSTVWGVPTMYTNVKASDEAEFVWEGYMNDIQANALKFKNGDIYFLLQSENPAKGSNHVGFFLIEGDKIYDFGGNGTGAVPEVGISQTFASGIDWSKASSQSLDDESGIDPHSGSSGNWYIHVYRICGSSGNLKIQKVDEHNVKIPGVTFHVKGQGIDANYVTDSEGKIELNDITPGEYTITEVALPDEPKGLILDTTEKKVTVVAGQTVEFKSTNHYQKGKARVHKVADRDESLNEGDSTLKGATYKLFAQENISEGSTLIYSAGQQVGQPVVTKEDGYTEFIENLPLGKYYWQEVDASTGYLLNDEKIEISIECDGQTSDKPVESEVLSVEKRKYDRAKVRKMDTTAGDGSEKEIAVGARIRLTLKSDENQYYEATVQEDGTAEFIDEKFKELYPDEEYTIPYGTYIITEVKGSTKDQNLHTQFYFQEQEVVLSENNRTYNVIVSDEGLEPYIKVEKTDSDNGEVVELAGAKFKIWDCQNNKFVTQMSTPSGKMIDEFETNDEGYFITPTYVQPGKYIIYETESPKGYVLNEKWRLPENEEDYGVEGKGGKLISLNKVSLTIDDDEVYDKDKKVVYTVQMDDEEYKGQIEVYKTGEMLTNVDYTSETAFDTKYELEQPKYEQKGLKGVKYTFTVKEDIMSPDGKHVKAEAGTKYTVTTDENGHAITDKLYCGKYEVTEEAPLGWVSDADIPDITVEKDITKPVNTETVNYSDPKQATEFSVEKSFETTKYKTKDEKIKVVIGLYNKEDIKKYDNTMTLIDQDTLLDVVYAEVTPGEKVKLTSDVNLPEGTYYFKELSVDYPYTIDDKEYEVSVKPTNTTEKTLKIEGPTIVNTPSTVGELSIVKLSTSCLVEADEDPIVGGLMTEKEMEKLSSPIVDWMRTVTLDEIKAVVTGQKKSGNDTVDKYDFKSYVLTNATYGIYVDAECTEPLLTTEDNQPVTITTDSVGFGKIDELPLGNYWLKELTAPQFVYEGEKIEYNLDPNPTKITLTQEDSGKLVCRALWDELSEGPTKKIVKTDLLTGEAIPDCEFVIKDKEGKEIYHARTDENGEFEMYLDVFKEGEEYTYTELNAPDIYNIDTTPHPFTVTFGEDGQIVKTEVTNTRKTRELIVRKTDADTGDPLEGCVFTIAMIDEETGNQKVNADGEPIYLVENAVTDENGEYVIADAPMGTYKFTEIKAPEGYELDEDLTGYTFTINNDSPETIIFEVTNTGDIAVIALAVVAVVCVAGIAFVVVRNKKKNAK